MRYCAWENIKENRVSAETEKAIIVQRTMKKTIQTTVGELCEHLLAELPQFIEHLYRAEHQHMIIQKTRESLSDIYLFVNIDFSQN